MRRWTAASAPPLNAGLHHPRVAAPRWMQDGVHGAGLNRARCRLETGPPQSTAHRTKPGSVCKLAEIAGLTETEETLTCFANRGSSCFRLVIDDLPQHVETPHGRITTIPIPSN